MCSLSIYKLSIGFDLTALKRVENSKSQVQDSRGWVPKFATGIYIIRRNAFIFNFLTRLDYKHKNWLISNFLNTFYLFWSAMWTPPYKSQWLVCSIWVQNVTNRTLNFEFFFCLQHRAYIKRLHNMYHLKFKNHYGLLRDC